MSTHDPDTTHRRRRNAAQRTQPAPHWSVVARNVATAVARLIVAAARAADILGLGPILLPWPWW